MCSETDISTLKLIVVQIERVSGSGKFSIHVDFFFALSLIFDLFSTRLLHERTHFCLPRQSVFFPPFQGKIQLKPHKSTIFKEKTHKWSIASIKLVAMALFFYTPNDKIRANFRVSLHSKEVGKGSDQRKINGIRSEKNAISQKSNSFVRLIPLLLTKNVV